MLLRKQIVFKLLLILTCARGLNIEEVRNLKDNIYLSNSNVDTKGIKHGYINELSTHYNKKLPKRNRYEYYQNFVPMNGDEQQMELLQNLPKPEHQYTINRFKGKRNLNYKKTPIHFDVPELEILENVDKPIVSLNDLMINKNGDELQQNINDVKYIDIQFKSPHKARARRHKRRPNQEVSDNFDKRYALVYVLNENGLTNPDGPVLFTNPNEDINDITGNYKNPDDFSQTDSQSVNYDRVNLKRDELLDIIKQINAINVDTDAYGKYDTENKFHMLRREPKLQIVSDKEIENTNTELFNFLYKLKKDTRHNKMERNDEIDKISQNEALRMPLFGTVGQLTSKQFKVKNPSRASRLNNLDQENMLPKLIYNLLNTKEKKETEYEDYNQYNPGDKSKRYEIIDLTDQYLGPNKFDQGYSKSIPGLTLSQLDTIRSILAKAIDEDLVDDATIEHEWIN